MPDRGLDHRPHPGPRLGGAKPFVGRALRDAWSYFTAEVTVGVQQHHDDITPAMNQVMILIDRDGTRIGELARRAGVTKQSMAEAVTGLERRGLVRRQPDPTDGRAQLIGLTDQGWDGLRMGRAVAEAVQDRWTTLIGERDMARLIALLTRLTRLLDAELDR